MAHMVKQVIHYSDGTTTEINYRGVIVDGVLTPDKPEEVVEEIKEAKPRKRAKASEQALYCELMTTQESY